jgi:hypothetical protein
MSIFCSRFAPSPRSRGKAVIARRSICARCNSPCRSGLRPAARRNRSRALVRSACRWRSRSLAANRRALGRWRSSLPRGGSPRRCRARHKLLVGINGHGFLADTAEAAVEAFFGPDAEVMSRIGRERGWPPLSRAGFDQGRGQRGHLMVGTPDGAIAKILAQHEVFRHDRTLMQMSVGAQPQDAILRSIELL